MNKSAGSKKLIKLVAASGIVESRIIKIENMQNIPNKALGNFIAAATNAFFNNFSTTRIIPSDTTKCAISNTLLDSVAEVLPLSEAMDLTESFWVSWEPICRNLELCPRTVIGLLSFLKLENLWGVETPLGATSVDLGWILWWLCFKLTQFAKEKCDCEWCDDKFWGTAEGVAAIATWTSVQVALNSKEKPFLFFFSFGL